MASRARNLANLLGGGEVTVPATKIADIPASKLSDEISTIEQVSDIDALTTTGILSVIRELLAIIFISGMDLAGLELP